MATRPLPPSRDGDADGAGTGSAPSANEVDLVRQLMRQTRRQDGDRSHRTESGGQRRESGTGQRAVARDGDGARQRLGPSDGADGAHDGATPTPDGDGAYDGVTGTSDDDGTHDGAAGSADRHCPRCRLTVPGDGRRFARVDCPRCQTNLESRPAPLFQSPLPSRFRAGPSRRAVGVAAAQAPSTDRVGA